MRKHIVKVLLMGQVKLAQIYVDVIGKGKISIPNEFQDIRDCRTFMNDIFALIPANEIKAMVFVEGTVESYRKTQNIRRIFRQLCKESDIFFHFPSHVLVMLISALKASNLTLNEGEHIAVVASFYFVKIRFIQFKENRYSYVASMDVPVDKLLAVKRSITRNYNLKHMVFIRTPFRSPQIASMMLDTSEKFKKIFSDIENSSMDSEFFAFDYCAIPDIIDFLMDGKVSKYLIPHYCDSQFNISSLIKTSKEDYLPLEKSVICSVKKNPSIGFCEKNFGEIKRCDLTEFSTEKVKITLTVDIDMIYDLAIESVGEPIEKLSKKIKDTGDKAKIVFSQDQFSIFLLRNGKKKIIKSGNGSTIFPLYINFSDETPSIGAAAQEASKIKPTFVIYDLMNICSEDVMKNQNPQWPFKVFQHPEKGILIGFDTFRGRRKTSPDFFLALILQFCSEILEKETEKKFEEFGIEFENLGSKETLKECFLKAAERYCVKLTFI